LWYTVVLATTFGPWGPRGGHERDPRGFPRRPPQGARWCAASPGVIRRPGVRRPPL